jgi:hypothetical protein
MMLSTSGNVLNVIVILMLMVIVVQWMIAIIHLLLVQRVVIINVINRADFIGSVFVLI